MSNVTFFKDIVIEGKNLTLQYDELNRGHRLIVQAFGDDLIDPWRSMSADEITAEITSRIESSILFDLNVDNADLDKFILANGVTAGSGDYIWEIIAPIPINEDIVAEVQKIIFVAHLGFKTPNIYVETFSEKYAPDPLIGKNSLPTLKEHVISFHGDRNFIYQNLHVKELLTILSKKLTDTLLENNFKNNGIINVFSIGHTRDIIGRISLSDNFAISIYNDHLDDIAGTADEVLEQIQDFITDLKFSTFHTIWLRTVSAPDNMSSYVF